MREVPGKITAGKQPGYHIGHYLSFTNDISDSPRLVPEQVVQELPPQAGAILAPPG